MTDIARVLTGNQLLDALPRDALDLLHLERVSLPLRMNLYKPDLPIADIYFVTEGLVSTVATLEDGAAVEIAVTGKEGFVGVPALLGDTSATHFVFVQAAGSGLRMSVRAMREAVERSPALKDSLFRYARFLLAEVSQTAACNVHHTLELRLARWLLIAHDRLGTAIMPLTHEFLAIMLGVQRPGVTLAAGALKRAGLIDYSHGVITVIDRAALEAASCACYRTIRNEYDRLFGAA
jgi:CRP-like cAMP-binding protein